MTDAAILAIDTSSMTASVAVYAGQVLAETTWHSGRRHSAELLRAIDDTLVRAQVEKTALKAIAVAAGPGSYSGLRVGISTGMAMALALEIGVVQVPTLETIAWPQQTSCDSHQSIRAAIDVGRGRFATACFRGGGGVEQESEIESFGLADLLELSSDEGSLLAVDLEPWVRADIERQYGSKIALSGPAASARRAGFLAELASMKIDRGELVGDGAVEPIYLRT